MKRLQKRTAQRCLLLLLVFLMSVGFGVQNVFAETVEVKQVYEQSTEDISYLYRVTTRDYDAMREVFEIVNQQRVENGLQPLLMDYRLNEVAMQRAAETTIYWSHTRPNGENCFTLFPSDWEKSAGENIAYGYSSAQGVMNGWMNSEGHRANILNSGYQYIGIGCVQYQGTYYWVQTFAGDLDYSEETRSNKESYGCYYEVSAQTCPNVQGENLSAVFDADYYCNKYTDIKNAFDQDSGKAYQHFVLYGMKEGRQGNSQFDVTSYRKRYMDLRRAYGNDLEKYYYHYVNYGKNEGRTATGDVQMQGVTVYQGVDYSAVYDYNYYTSRYQDIAKAYGLDDFAVLQHFVLYGMNEGRQGNEAFNINSYKNRYVDLRNAYGNDLKSYYMHYIRYGKKEGRLASGEVTITSGVTVYQGVNYSDVYDYQYYISHNADVAKAYPNDDIAVLKHFVLYGMKEGRQAKDSFSAQVYQKRYADLRKAYGNDWKSYYLHYMNYGKSEGRSGK